MSTTKLTVVRYLQGAVAGVTELEPGTVPFIHVMEYLDLLKERIAEGSQRGTMVATEGTVATHDDGAEEKWLFLEETA